MLTVSDISMNFGDKMLFEGVDVTFNDGERYGLTGPNGAGKTTFMKIISKELETTGGQVTVKGRLGACWALRLSNCEFTARMRSPAMAKVVG